MTSSHTTKHTVAKGLSRQLLRAVAIFFLVTFAAYGLMFGDGPGIAQAVLGTQATEGDVHREVVRLGLDRSLFEQYGDWITGLFTGDLGRSFFTGQSVTEALASRVPVTLILVALTLVFTLVFGVLLGVAAAKRGGWVDRVLQFLSVLGAAVPPFIVAILLVFWLAIAVRVFPATGYEAPVEGIGPWAASITLPVSALLITSVANAAVQFRGTMIDTLGADYIRTLRARGIPESRVLFRHALRNAAGPGLTVLSLQTLGLLGGAIFIEQVFALPGMGQMANESAQLGDVPMVMGSVAVTIVIVLAVNYLADLANSALNPKARLG